MSSFLSRKKKPEKYELKSAGDDLVKDNYGSVTSLVNNEVSSIDLYTANFIGKLSEQMS